MKIDIVLYINYNENRFWMSFRNPSKTPREVPHDMNEKAIQAARQAYDIEAECIREMKDYFDEAAFSEAVDLLINTLYFFTKVLP